MMKTIIITGAGSGMGEATAKLLSENPENSLILIGRSQSRLNDVLECLSNRENHASLAVDICNARALRLGLADLLKHKSLECVFANAGIGGENAYGEDDRWHEIIQTNLTGTYNTIMEALPYLKLSQERFKHILITSSCLARFGVPRYTGYCTAKTGLLGLMRSLAVELGQDKILVNALTPGWVETDMAVAGVEKLAEANGRPLSEEMAIQQSIVPLGRFSQPEEIANFVDFLFSEKQTSITGQALDINNGSFMI